MLFRRKRPLYAEQSKFYCIYGEWFSFPSGHSLRAFYALFWLSRSRFVTLLAPFIRFPNAFSLFPWALGVGISRVVKGRHYPIDVLVGSIVGSIVGYIVEDLLDSFTRATLKTMCGIYTAINWMFLVVIPLICGRDVREGSIQSKILTSCAYLAYGILVLVFTLPPTKDSAGTQTVVPHEIEGDLYQCKSIW